MNSWLIALFVPFFIAGAWGAYYGYHYQWKDIYVRHPGAFQYMNDADANQSCWEFAKLVGLVFAVPAGLLGLGLRIIWPDTKSSQHYMRLVANIVLQIRAVQHSMLPKTSTLRAVQTPLHRAITQIVD